MIVLGRGDLNGTRRDLAIGAHHHHAVTLIGARDGLLRHRDGIVCLRLFDAYAHVQSRQQLAIGVRHFGAQRDLAGRRIDGQIGEQQLARFGVEAAVFEHQLDTRGLGARRTLELTRGHGVAQLHHFGGGLRKVDVHRVDLLHDGELRCLALADERTFGHECASDAARDRRGDAGVAQIDIGRGEGGLGGGHVCLRGTLGGDGIHVVLLADRVGLDQRLEAVGLRSRLREVRFGTCHAGLRALQGRLIWRRVDREQRLPCAHIAALAEQALLQDAGGARADLCHARGLETARQFGDETDITLRNGHHAHLGRWWRASGCTAGGRSIGLLAATGDQCGGEERHREDCDGAQTRGNGGGLS